MSGSNLLIFNDKQSTDQSWPPFKMILMKTTIYKCPPSDSGLTTNMLFSGMTVVVSFSSLEIQKDSSFLSGSVIRIDIEIHHRSSSAWVEVSP